LAARTTLPSVSAEGPDLRHRAPRRHLRARRPCRHRRSAEQLRAAPMAVAATAPFRRGLLGRLISAGIPARLDRFVPPDASNSTCSVFSAASCGGASSGCSGAGSSPALPGPKRRSRALEQKRPDLVVLTLSADEQHDFITFDQGRVRSRHNYVAVPDESDDSRTRGKRAIRTRYPEPASRRQGHLHEARRPPRTAEGARGSRPRRLPRRGRPGDGESTPPRPRPRSR